MGLFSKRYDRPLSSCIGGISSCSNKNSSCWTEMSSPPPAGNPDPRNFSIVRLYQMGDYLAAELRYPDCTNYEGRKVLVFHGLSKEQLQELTEIDPHFCDGAHASPIARFAPTDDGWHDAQVYVTRKATR